MSYRKNPPRTLANTGEPLFLVNRSGNRPSSEGAAERFDQARALCQDAGFRRITFRGDTDFSQTAHLDRWDAAGVRFIFGYDAYATLVREADALPASAWTPLVRRPPYEVETEPRQRPANVKAATIVTREFKTRRLAAEAVAEFPYQPIACAKPYRMVVVRKNISVEQGDQRLFDQIRYFFYVTNDRDTVTPELVFLANDRGNQENLIDQLRHGVGATRMPVDTLLSNGYLTAISLRAGADAHRRLAELYEVLGRTAESARERVAHLERRLEELQQRAEEGAPGR